MRTCIKCKENKELDLFIKRADRPLGRGTICKLCQSKRIRKLQLENPDKYRYTTERSIKRHGLTIDQYNDLWESQEGLCAICKSESKLFIDHDHKCCAGTYGCANCVRGLLCHRCNTAIGSMGDNKEILMSAVEYLGGMVSG